MNGTQITLREWFRLPKTERQHRIAVFREADEALQSYRPPSRQEDETYLRLRRQRAAAQSPEPAGQTA